MTGDPISHSPGVLVLDGGTGSELRRHGVALSKQCWSATANLEQPVLLGTIHREFLLAGADIVTTNTFAASRFVLAHAGLAGRFDEITGRAISVAREAAATVAGSTGREILVAGSLSCLPPGFDTSDYPDEATEEHAYVELAEKFANSGCDLILLEMLEHPLHAARACRAAREAGLPFWAGISCRIAPAAGPVDDGADRLSEAHGPAEGNTRPTLVGFDEPSQSFAAILEAILPFEPNGIAVMHTPVRVLSQALDELGRRWPGPTGAYAEIPYAEDPDSRPGEAEPSPEDYAASARSWIEAGVTLIGGCCGTGPAHIAALRRLVDGAGD